MSTPDKRFASGHRPLLLSWLARQVVVGLVWLVGTCGAQAAEPASHAPREIEYRRIFAPADRIDDWPLGKEPYLPIAPDQFDALLRRARAAAAGVPDLVMSRVTQARYEARLDDAGNLIGQALLEISHQGDRAVSLPLGPCRLAIEQAVWQDSDGQPARLGLQPNGELALMVEHPGQLHIEWTQRAVGQQDDLQYDLALVPCPLQRIMINLPEGDRPVLAGGLVSDVGPVAGHRRQWRLEPGARAQFELRIRRGQEVAASTARAAVREATTYDFSPRGVEVSAQFAIDDPERPLHAIRVSLAPTLRLVAARYGEQKIAWVAESSAEQTENQVVLQLPEPLVGTGQTIRLLAIAPPVAAGAWRLPRIRLPDLKWSEGRIEMMIPRPLVLEQLDTQGCTQTRTLRLPEPRLGELIELQQFQEDCQVQVVVRRDETKLQVRQGTTIEVGASEVVGQMTAQLTVDGAPQFTLDAKFPQDWIIDSITSVPEEAIADWSMRRGKDGSGEVAIRLAKGLAVGRTLKIVARGHLRRSNLDELLPALRLRMLDFQQAQLAADWLLVRASDPYRLASEGDERLLQVDPATLEVETVELLNGPWSGMLFDHGADTRRLAFRLVTAGARYEAALALEAQVENDSLTESLVIRCTPIESRIDRLLVHFTQRRANPWRWTLATDGEPQLSAQRILVAEGTEEASPQGETWEIVLRQARSVPFEIRATCTVPVKPAMAIGLAGLPQAASQSATVSVMAGRRFAVGLANERLEPIPPEPWADEKTTAARMVFRYEPARDALQGAPVAIRVQRRSHVSPGSSAWVWNCDVQSQYARDGKAIHSACYAIENIGHRQVRLSWPAELRFRSAWLDGTLVKPTQHLGGQREIAIPLPTGERFPQLVVRYETEQLAGSLTRSERPLVPQIDLPVIRRQWTLWVPSGYTVRSADASWLESVPWRERIFGPLARTASLPFHPGRLTDWSTMFSVEPAAERDRAWVRALLERLGQALPADDSGRQLTWGAWLEMAESLQTVGPRRTAVWEPLLVDEQSLAAGEILPEGLVPWQDVHGPSLQQAVEILQRAKLALLVAPGAVVLTTEVEAATRANRAPLLPEVAAYAFEASGKQGHLATTPDRPWVAVADWNEAGGLVKLPWTSTGIPRLPRQGWNAFRVADWSPETTTVQVVDRVAIQALSGASFLFAFAMVLWGSRRQARLGWLALAASGTLALAMPVIYAPIATGAVLGSLAALALQAIALHDSGRRKLPATTASLALLLSIAPEAVFGQTVPEPVQASDQMRPEVKIHRVFIPIDDDRKPTGGMYQVPESLLHDLTRRAETVSGVPRGWLLTAADYRLRLVRGMDEDAPQMVQARAVFSITVLHRNRPIRIALDPRDLAHRPLVAQVDGRDQPLAWDVEGGYCELPGQPSGEHRVTIQFRPKLLATPTGTRVDFRVPRLPSSTIAVEAAVGQSQPRLPGIAGAVRLDRAAGMLRGRLGSAKRIQADWAVAPHGATQALRFDALQLLWLDVRPGTVVLSARFKLRVSQGELTRLRIEADPRLRLLPAPPDAPVRLIETIPGVRTTYVWELKRPAQDQVVFEGRWLLRGVSGVGKLSLPFLRLLDTATTERLLGVSVDKSLESEVKAAEGKLQPTDVMEFFGHWGIEHQPPQRAYALDSQTVGWTLATWPQSPQMTAQQTLALSFRRRSALVAYEVAIETRRGFYLRQMLAIPKELVVDSVSVTQNRTEQAVRWSRTDDGTLTVFLKQPLSGTHRLRLTGNIPVPATQRFTVPKIALRSASGEVAPQGLLGPLRLNVYRLPEVLVDLPDDGLASLDQPKRRPAHAAGRWVASFLVLPDAVPLGFRVSANEPKVQSTLVTRMVPRGDRWAVEVDYRAEVEQGRLDAIYFDLPAWFANSPEVAPAADTVLADLPGQPHQRLIVRPRQALAGKVAFRMNFPLDLEAGQSLRVPEIVPIGPGNVQRYVVLPKQTGEKQITWRTRGLQPAKPPWLMPQRLESYLVFGRDFSAVPQMSGATLGTPQIELADVSITWQADGRMHAVATFDLEPAGLAECRIRFPKQFELLQAMVADQPASLRRAGSGDWRVATISRRLPQRVAVLFSGAIERLADQQVRLVVPELWAHGKPIPVTRGLWTVSGPAGYRPIQASRGDQIGVVSAAGQRVESMGRLLSRAADIDQRQSAEEIQRWYWPWARRFLASERALVHAIAAAGRETISREVQTTATTAHDEQLRLARRLGVMAQYAKLRGETSTVSQLGNLYRDLHRGTASRWSEPGTAWQPVVEVDYAEPDRGDWLWRWLVVLGLATSLGIAVRGCHLATMGEWLWRWPHLMVAIVGLVWWLWLAPSVVGLALMFVGLYLAVRRAWNAGEAPVLLLILVLFP